MQLFLALHVTLFALVFYKYNTAPEFSAFRSWQYISFGEGFCVLYQRGLCFDIDADVQEDHDIPYDSYKGIPLNIALRRTCKVSQGKTVWYRLRKLH